LVDELTSEEVNKLTTLPVNKRTHKQGDQLTS